MKTISTLIITTLALGLSGCFTTSILLFSLSAISLLLLVVAIYDVNQTKHTLWTNYPIIGRGRWIAEGLRPKLLQYFVESDTNGTPFTREQRSLVYQRAKNETESVPFGTEHNLNEVGTEWVSHSMYPTKITEEPRITIGASRKQSYSASILNISAM